MISEISKLHNEMLMKAIKSNRIEREMNVLLVRFEKANWYLSNVVMHSEQWHDHQDAINFAKSWVFDCAQAIADYKSY